VAGGNCETDGEGGRSLDVVTVGVAHSEDDKQQQEAEEELHAEALKRVQFVVDGGHAQVSAQVLGGQRLKQTKKKDSFSHSYATGPTQRHGGCISRFSRDTHLEDSRAHGGSQTLDHDVQDALDDGDVAGHHHGDGHRRVDVAAAHMAHHLESKETFFNFCSLTALTKLILLNIS